MKLFPPRYEKCENSTQGEIVDGNLTFKSPPLNESKGKFCLKEKQWRRNTRLLGRSMNRKTVDNCYLQLYLLTVELQMDRSYRYRWHKVAFHLLIFFRGARVAREWSQSTIVTTRFVLSNNVPSTLHSLTRVSVGVFLPSRCYEVRNAWSTGGIHIHLRPPRELHQPWQVCGVN